MIFSADDYLEHYGVARRSGRYPWGSGDNAVAQDSRGFLDNAQKLKEQGLSESQIAKGWGISTSELRAYKSIARNEHRAAQIAEAQRLKDKGYSNVAVGQKMGINESSVRSLLAPGRKDKNDVLMTTVNLLKDQVAEKKYVDVGVGVERHLSISKDKLKTAVAALETEGYKIHYLKIRQLGTGKETTMKVLAGPGVTYSEVSKNRADIKQIMDFSDDGGRTYFSPPSKPLSIDAKRVGVNWAEDGGANADGVIYVRPGVSDCSLGKANYAQVRIAVNDTHYLKGMAVYKDDLPPGVDLVFNTNKARSADKLDAMKPLNRDAEGNVDQDLPFKSIVRPQMARDKDGKEYVTSVMNIVNDEGQWDDWSKTLSTQMLSKQSPALVKNQLDVTYEKKLKTYNEIMSLTNPTVKKKLLEDYSDELDSSATHLKAAAIPNQATKVILPINSLKDTEIYAPSFTNGETVVLVRYPHGGIFEIPELRVNNRNPEAKKILGTAAKDAVGINSKVAEKLSGADFDGDTVLVIPNNPDSRLRIKTAPTLAGLKNFDPKALYPAYEGMPKMSAEMKGQQMGSISNLITDMTIKGASQDELARAVRHSMVVIDAEKHNLNYKQSALDNGIPALKTKYQGGANKGSATLISRSGSEMYVPERRAARVNEGGPIDKATGKKVYVPTGEKVTVTTKSGKTKVEPKMQKTNKLFEADDAFKLVSDDGGTPVERLYATHSNKLKALANSARKEMVHTENLKYSPSAKKAYAKEVASLDAKLNVALQNAPLERQAQLIANTEVSAKRKANPDLEASELKKIKSTSLNKARNRMNASKKDIEITPSEWEAIQAGAISNEKLSNILNNTDMDKVKKYALPKEQVLMSSAKQQRAASMLASGYTQAEVAAHLGVSLTTLKTSLQKGS